MNKSISHCSVSRFTARWGISFGFIMTEMIIHIAGGIIVFMSNTFFNPSACGEARSSSSWMFLSSLLQIKHMMAFIEQEANEKAEEIDAKVKSHSGKNGWLILPFFFGSFWPFYIFYEWVNRREMTGIGLQLSKMWITCFLKNGSFCPQHKYH